jgi:hypothetical protein
VRGGDAVQRGIKLIGGHQCVRAIVPVSEVPGSLTGEAAMDQVDTHRFSSLMAARE